MNLVDVIKSFLRDIRVFSRVVVRRPLRAYQLEPARAIADSVLHRRGLTFAVVMSRQAGKNELSAQLEAYLMNWFQQEHGAALVKASPTYRPQTLNSKLRLRDCLDNAWNRDRLRCDEGYIVRLGHCRALFFSAHPSANVVGATANVLLECDEAQDVDEDKWNKDFAPMGAAHNVTTVFYGTLWTARTLLGHVVRRLREEEARDGVQRVFLVPWQRVAQEVPAYGEYVRKELQRLGEGHPIVKTQYLLQEIDDAGRLFPAERMAHMRGRHARRREPAVNGWGTDQRMASDLPAADGSTSGCEAGAAGSLYALAIDVAGEDEALEGADLRAANPRKDSTVVTVVRVDLGGLDDPLLGLPRYEVVNRYGWTGRQHADLYAAILDLVEQWQAAAVVVDATGVGAGLASFLQRRLGTARPHNAGSAQAQRAGVARRAIRAPGLVLPVEFNLASKSDLGWDFLGLIETGRFKDYVEDGASDTRQFWREVEACEFEVLPGPGQRMRWGVRDPALHDDYLISAALVSRLDALAWRADVQGEIIAPGNEE